jgi:opacity protein-like surface antigen
MPHRLLLAGVVSALTLVTIPARAAAQTHDEGRLFVRGYGGVQWSSPDTVIADTQRAGVIGGGIGWNLTDQFALTGEVGYTPNVATTNGVLALTRLLAVINLVAGADVSLRERTVFVLGGARYTIGHGPVRGFIDGQAGGARASYRLTLSSATTGIGVDLLTSRSSAEPTAGVGGGVNVRLTRVVSAEGEYRYLRLFGDATANIHQVLGGLKFSF